MTSDQTDIYLTDIRWIGIQSLCVIILYLVHSYFCSYAVVSNLLTFFNELFFLTLLLYFAMVLVMLQILYYSSVVILK